MLKNLVRAVNHFVRIASFDKHRTFWRNAADTYDWHCCSYRTFRTQEELLRLFADLGMVEVTITNPSDRGAINIVGWKPSVPAVTVAVRAGAAMAPGEPPAGFCP